MQKRKEGAIRAGRPIHGIRASALFRYLTERGLDSHAEHTYAPQSRAEQSRAEQSRAEHRLTALFCHALELNTVFVMDNRRILTG